MSGCAYKAYIGGVRVFLTGVLTADEIAAFTANPDVMPEDSAEVFRLVPGSVEMVNPYPGADRCTERQRNLHGSGESYIDRKFGNEVGVWNSTVSDSHFLDKATRTLRYAHILYHSAKRSTQHSQMIYVALLDKSVDPDWTSFMRGCAEQRRSADAKTVRTFKKF